MKNINKLNLPEKLQYTEDHEWIKKENGMLKIGVTDFAQDQLGEIVFVEMPEVGDNFSANDEFGTIESVKAVSEMYMPVSGEVIEINEALEDSPELVNNSCYEDGWIIKIKPSDINELDKLLDKNTYLNLLKG